MNKTVLQGKWRRMRGNLKTEWGRLTDNDRRQLDGKLDQMVGLVQERYGYTQNRATKLLSRYLTAYGKRKEMRANGMARMWLPAMLGLGIFGLATMGWFFFARFLADSTDITMPTTREPEPFINPEAEFS
jgi:uncharacterized protein YjbJ (UPF0337 family)